MNNSILKVEDLCHKYNNTWAIKNINLEISRPGITGLLGSNGAGKSTTMNIMCGVLNQTSGKVQIGGVDLRKDPEAAKMKLGFLPQNPPLYMDFSVDEYLLFCARLRKVDSRVVANAVETVKEHCGLKSFGSKLIGSLSGGYRQRVGIAQAIIHQPELVVLDEPTNGLDPNQIIEVRRLIKEIAKERAVIFSSHILSEVQLLCDQITMIESGRIVFADTIDAFNNYVEPHSLMVTMLNPPSEVELLSILGISRVEQLTDRQFRITFNHDQEISERIIAESVARGWRLREIILDKTSIEEIFAQLSNNKLLANKNENDISDRQG